MCVWLFFRRGGRIPQRFSGERKEGDVPGRRNIAHPHVLVHVGCCNKTPQIGGLIKIGIYVSLFWNLDVQDQGRWHIRVRVLFWVTDFLLYLHVADGARAFSWPTLIGIRFK